MAKRPKRVRRCGYCDDPFDPATSLFQCVEIRGPGWEYVDVLLPTLCNACAADAVMLAAQNVYVSGELH